ncbi:MAG: DUF5685 family protein [Clostridia bacterium]|nr:DUF5685 family protein [Clostridia bacterium]
MFGYVKPLECELKVKEQAVYHAAYCGLCKAIRRRHGYFASAVLTYDCTFLALLLSSLCEDSVAYQKCRCLHRCNRPRKVNVCPNASFFYAADCNVMLSYYKCRDDWKDERKITRGIAALYLGRKVRRIKKDYPDLVGTVETCLGELSALEGAACADADAVADCFARLLASIARHSPATSESERTVLSWLFYNLGRWIYLIDAANDMEEDSKKGRYNPFNAAKRSKDDTVYALYKSLAEAGNALALLQLKRNESLLENIITLGCMNRTRDILKGEER